MQIHRHNRKDIFILLVVMALFIAMADQAPLTEANGLPPKTAAAKTGSVKKSALEIRFEGNKKLSDSALKNAVNEEASDLDLAGQWRSRADDWAYQMEVEYRKAGYAFAHVDYRLDQLQDKRAVVFVVFEGPRAVLSAMNFIGASAFKQEELLSSFELKAVDSNSKAGWIFVESGIHSGVSNIKDLYNEAGFLDAVVEDPIVEFQEERTRAVVSVNIREGTRYFVSMVQFSGDLPGQAEKKLSGLKKKIKNKPLSPQWKFTIRGRIEEIYGDMGYPFVQVEITEKAGEKEGDVCLDAAIKSGERARISSIKVSGNVKTYESFIKNRLLFQPGDYYSLEKKRQSFRNLFKSGLFSKVNITLKEGEGPGDNILAVQVEESPSREFSIEGGWGSYELLRIKAGFKENNIFGSGRIFRAEASGSFKGESVLSGITDPWFLNTGVTADFPLNYRRRREPSFTREELGIAPHFSKNLTEHLNMSVGYTYRGTNLSNIRVSTVEEDLNHGYNIGSLKAQANYDSRNDIFFPDSGQRSFLSCELAESGLGSQINLFRLTAGTRWFIPITSSTVLGLRYDTGFLLPGGNKVSVPISERFFNGGENSVRSFTESQLGPHDQGDPVGGLAFNLATVEIRQKIWKNFAATLFTDSGNLSPALSSTFANYFKDFRHGVGFGLQYLLPIGPARLDFAMNPDPKKQYQYEEDRFALHFSIGMAF